MNNKEPILRLQDICKSYMQADQPRLILDNAKLEIHSGEIIAIIGRSGSGKSTLLNMMSGIDKPDSGKVIISQQVINELSEYERTCYRREHMGFVFQFFNLIPTLTVRENILLPLELNKSLNPSNIDFIESLLFKIGLNNRINHYPDQLSGGEQQRIAILRAIAHKPKLVFADEPTGNLDAETGADVLNLLQDMVRNFNMTLLMVTHSSDVSEIANRVFAMKHGKLVKLQNHD